MPSIFYGVLAIIVFLVLMFAGMNIPFAMIFSGATAMIFYKSTAVAGQIVSSEITATFSDYSLTVAPMFGLMGFIATYTGLGSKLFICIKRFVGHYRGGLAAAVQVASAGFGAICGSVPATSATMTAVAYPEMRKAGYSVEISALSIAEGATLSVLIPPSATMIIFGIATENSISKLFMAGIVPGIIMCLLNINLIMLMCRIRKDWGPAGPKSTWKERFDSIKGGGLIEVLIVFVVAMGGMWGGVFTPTEAGAVGVFGMAIVTIAGKNLNFKRLRNALIEGVRMTAMMYLLMAGAKIFGVGLTITGVPSALGSLVRGNNFPPVACLLLIILIYFISGMIADFMSMMLVTIPIFYPIIVDYCGYDPMYFAVLIILMHSIGSLTPPVGITIFMQKVFIAPFDPDVQIARLFRAIWPWIGQRFALIVIFSIFPILVTFLPDLVS